MTFITMSAKELDKFHVIKKLIDKHITGTDAAKLLKLSIRQTKRLKAKVKQCGAKGLIHGNRGQQSNNRLDDIEREKIISLLHKNYYDFGPTFATEKLLENHNIHHDSKTIRQIMIDKNLWKPKIKKSKQVHRSWRERRSSYGELEQFDGSYEYWFEDRGPKCCLLASIDDATGKITAAKFDANEGVFPVFTFWQKYLENNGKPRAIYLDKFSTYNMNQPLAKENPDTLTQFQRAMSELHIEVIPANSPQAKGRVERLFGTLQDRLIKELRLANISNTEKANEFLNKIFIKKFNGRFSVIPKSKTDLHQKLNGKEMKQLNGILARHTTRTAQNDFTISYKNQWYQLTKNQPATICKKDQIIVEERTDKTIHLRLRNKYLNYKLLPARPQKALSKIPWVLAATSKETTNETNKKSHKPSPNHPWRKPFIFN